MQATKQIQAHITDPQTGATSYMPVDVLYEKGDYAVTPQFTPYGEEYYSLDYTVTHIESGYAIAPHGWFDDEEWAIKWCNVLATISTNGDIYQTSDGSWHMTPGMIEKVKKAWNEF